MSYSDSQFQRELLKTLDKIADELHKMNEISKKEIKQNEKTIDVKVDEKSNEDKGYKTVRYEEFLTKNMPSADLFTNIYNEVFRTHYKSFDKFVIDNINRLTDWGIDVDNPDIPYLSEHIAIKAFESLASTGSDYHVCADGELLFSFTERMEYRNNPLTFEYEGKIVYEITKERKLERK